MWPHFTEASEQFAAAVTHPLRWKPTLLELFVGPRSKRAWAIPFLATTTALLLLAIWRSAIRPECVPKHLRALALSVPFAIGVHALLQRPGYDYRLLGHLLLAERDYEELTTPRISTGCEIELPVIQQRIPVSRSPCDWNLQIWKRKASPDEDPTVRSS